MNKTPIYIFTISLLLLFPSTLIAQEKRAVVDTLISYQEKFGIRAGLDFTKLARTLLDDDYQGLEAMGDYRVYKNYYLAAELGNEDYSYTEPDLAANTNGSYFKIGANYNAYDNWLGMQNELYVGVRYGFSTFSHTLEAYRVYTTDNYFPEDVRTVNREYNGLTKSWLELQMGIKAEIFNNLFLSVHVQLKNSFGENDLDGFENLYIPGFHRTYRDSSIGVGWGYGISYMIPIIKKDRVQEVSN